MNIAIIPARGGSKRIPRKNIKTFCGKPIMAWSISAAIASSCFDRIIVSTDDQEIADIAQAWGAEVPFIRPANLADDHTDTISVVNHAIRQLMLNGQSPEFVCCIDATAPFVVFTNLATALQSLIEHSSNYAFSVTSFPFPIQRALKVTDEGRVSMFYPEHQATRSQDLEKAYHDAGQFYWGRAQAFLDRQPIFSSHAVPIVLPRYQVQDIDTLEDWQHAELSFSTLQEISSSSSLTHPHPD
jgi:N-acylneuraminate cytidylyltransferase